VKPPVLIFVVMLATGCARFVANRVGDAMAGSGGVFASDNDPELIRDAAPFALKMEESLLEKSPRHRGLLLATTSGFTQYGYAFVQLEADELETRDVAGAQALRERARKLYLRARDYGLRGLRVNEAGFDKAVKRAGKGDVPLLFWTAASWGAAISISKNNPDLVADVPKVGALVDRALALDERFERGAIHTFLISYEMARPGLSPAERERRAKQHFERAVELSAGKLAGPFVAYAEAVCVQKQQRAEFEKLLKQALDIDVDQAPESRLANLVTQRRARWLLSRVDELFAE
jgi:predicted anti-sigma-YlaC factor YlaD